MIRLIIEYTQTDGCTYSFREIIPILYESRNKLHRDFETWCINDRDNGLGKKFMKTGIESNNFFEDGIYYPPVITELDVWFELNTGSKL